MSTIHKFSAVFSFAASLVLATSIGTTVKASTNGVASPGYDVFTAAIAPGSLYRYGPSFIVNGNGNIDMWTCSPGQPFWSENFQISGSPQADPLTGSNTAAQKFITTKAFYNVDVLVPTFGAQNAGITVSLYLWNTDYTTTVSGTPLASYTWTNIATDSNLQQPPLSLTTTTGHTSLPFPSLSTSQGYYPPGTYLWVVSNPMSTAGVWQYTGSQQSGNVNYLNGSQISGGDFLANIDYSNWDYIRHSVSTDGGQTFGSESVALQPTNLSDDHYSTCDPAVVEFGGYYYIGYTSTQNANGTSAEVYVARGSSPTGPWEKWNGSGWGGNPVSFIKYNPQPYNYYDYGIGEPSFVILNNTLYIYYSLYSHDSSGNPISQVLVATAPTTNPNWPANVTLHSTPAIYRNGSMDAADVKYIDAYSKFFAVTTANRLSPMSYIQAWESTDGLSFHPSNMSPGQLQPYLFQVGLSGDSSGHLNTSASNFIAYAYGSYWALWNTGLNPISLSDDALPAPPHIYAAVGWNGSVSLAFQSDATATSYNVKYGTTPGTYTNTITAIAANPAGPAALTYTVAGLSNGTKYYFVVDAVNSNGTSNDGQAVSATPQNYSLITMAGVTASSHLSGWEPSNAIDGNSATNYSSAGHSGPQNTEWIYLDAGSNQNIARLVITARKPTGLAAPNMFSAQVQVSNDATNWFDISGGAGDVFQIVRSPIDLPQPISARYVRLYATSLNRDQYDNYYLQLAEFQAYSVPEVAIASSTTPPFYPYWLLDRDPSSTYSSELVASSAVPEYAGVNLGSPQQVTGINLTPSQQGNCFPVDFTLDSSPDGTTWTTIPGQSYNNYPPPGIDTQAFNFSNPVMAQYFRINATTLGSCGGGSYALQLGSFAVKQSINFTATASSALAGWPASNTQDGIPATMWSSNQHTTKDATEWLQLDMGSSHTVRDLRLIPRNYQQDYFPAQFKIQSSTDGATWTTVQNYTAYTDPAAPPMSRQGGSQLFFFGVPVTARYFRIYATQLTDGGGDGYYYFQLSDIFIDQ